MRKNLFLLIMALFIISSSAYAQSFEVSVISIKDRIAVDEIAEYDFVIKNHMNSTEDFTIRKANYPNWDMYVLSRTSPITVTVPPRTEVSTRIYVDPVYVTSVDTYTLEPSVIIESTGFEQKVPL